MMELLDRKKDFSAVFCVTDNAALGAMNALKARGFNIPADISVAGFDDIDMASHIVPRLTTMRVDRTRMGLMAFRKLLEVMGESKKELPKHILVRPELVVRDSCGTRP
jgi:LacI family transcriptional regulator